MEPDTSPTVVLPFRRRLFEVVTGRWSNAIEAHADYFDASRTSFRSRLVDAVAGEWSGSNAPDEYRETVGSQRNQQPQRPAESPAPDTEPSKRRSKSPQYQRARRGREIFIPLALGFAAIVLLIVAGFTTLGLVVSLSRQVPVSKTLRPSPSDTDPTGDVDTQFGWLLIAIGTTLVALGVVAIILVWRRDRYDDGGLESSVGPATPPTEINTSAAAAPTESSLSKDLTKITSASGPTAIVLTPRSPYPVLDSANLRPVQKIPFRRRRRTLDEIPTVPPGAVLAFQAGNKYYVASDGTPNLDADVVIDADAVFVVSLRHEMREAVAYLPTSDPTTAVVVRARFHCLVTDPQLLLDSGCWDVDPILTDHLVADRRLRFMTQDTDPRGQWEHYRRNAAARLIAYHDLQPLVVPGLLATLVDVAVDLQELQPLPAKEQSAVPADEVSVTPVSGSRMRPSEP